ncbi:plasmid segregation protein ParM [Caloranaerobacter azorensis DSM 13643]|uniref:Plasmid segregation protein ParM n=1 Tax=Caloranaerobacter azorensis DSM 13643 TaxID=1121264 RepID=A0A1M5VKQ7_9FIRM|nr:ParM/StbA family protein [Caloranaerobacter azorensis]SHH75852.1 plasmid segregation protein ParM [Caloranaerobacter azorensis DSM 13643]
MKTIIIGVDQGNRYIKSREGIYSCGFIVSRSEPLGMDEVIEFQGKYYCIGGSRKKYRQDKTIDDTYFILTLPAIAKRLEKEMLNEADIILGIGLPLSHFNLKKKYIDYFTRGKVEFKYNNKKYLINIKEVMCFPQALSGYMLFYNKYKGIDFINLFDFGQVTLDAVKIHNGKPLLDTAISLNYGMLRLIKTIQENIRKELGIEISEEQIETNLQGRRGIFFKDEIEEIIKRTTVDFVNEMLGELRESQFELQATMNLFMGGGSSIIQNTLDLNKHNGRIGYYEVMENAQLANALGYEILVKEALKRR